MGLEIPEPPEYSYVANFILKTYNTIARSRRYEQGTPLTLDAGTVFQYLEKIELPCDFRIILECIFEIDNSFVDKAYKKLSGKVKK